MPFEGAPPFDGAALSEQMSLRPNVVLYLLALCRVCESLVMCVCFLFLLLLLYFYVKVFYILICIFVYECFAFMYVCALRSWLVL